MSFLPLSPPVYPALRSSVPKQFALLHPGALPQPWGRGSFSSRLNFGIKRLVSHQANTLWFHHAYGMPYIECKLSELLEASKSPDPESVDLIEQAFLEGQIDC